MKKALHCTRKCKAFSLQKPPTTNHSKEDCVKQYIIHMRKSQHQFRRAALSGLLFLLFTESGRFFDEFGQFTDKFWTFYALEWECIEYTPSQKTSWNAPCIVSPTSTNCCELCFADDNALSLTYVVAVRERFVYLVIQGSLKVAISHLEFTLNRRV